jgi:hypothetical protein
MLDESLVGVDAQMVSPQVAQEYVLADELDQYMGSTIVRGLVPGQPLMYRDLVDADNPAAYRHLALALEDPNLVAMVIPVGEENTPDGIVPGDRIAIVWSVGETSNYMAGPVGSTSSDVAGPGETIGGAGTGTETGTGVEVPGGESLPPEVAALLGDGVDQPTPEVTLPLAKTVINVADVVRVRREQEANPAYTGEEGETPYIEGAVTGLEVAVPREEMEAIQFAVANGEYSIVVLSPNADPREVAEAASLGVMWQDVLDYFQADRLRALGVLTVTEAIRPAGAANLYGPVLAPAPLSGSSSGSNSQPVVGAVPRPSGTATPSPDDAGEGGEQPTAEAGEPTATPAPLPTATPVSVSDAGSGGSEEPAPSNLGEEPSGGGSILTASTGNLLAGVGCVVAVLLVIGAGVVLAIRALRKRGQDQA